MSRDIENVKVRLSEEGYCVFPNVLEAKEAKNLEDICRERIEAVKAQSGHATGGGEYYISLEDALNVVPELAPLCMHPLVMKLQKPSSEKILYWRLRKYDGPSRARRLARYMQTGL